ncbi:MAG: hypothetical protein JOY80_09115 [Candidatus Dormibacteraeota bacterium]|nr:hypothetical protein [Candidatus Dormibacteraeota bacterium]
MAQGVDEARQQRELTKHALASDLDRLEARVRSELDWRARLRRDGPRIAAIGAAVLAVAATVLILRSRLRRHEDEEPDEAPSLDDVALELREIRKTLEKHNGKSSSFVQKALLRGVSAAGSAGGQLVAKQMMQRQSAAAKEGTEATRAG